MASSIPTSPETEKACHDHEQFFASNVQAFDILAEHGIDRTGIQLIKDQVGRFSAGYRRPEERLADVLQGGTVVLPNRVLLLNGLGSLRRGSLSGDCADVTRAVTQEWAGSSFSRRLGRAGLHPFYLEVATPALFRDVWQHNGRVRSGHSVLAVGSPKQYMEQGIDTSFVFIDPTLGVIEPMTSSNYYQTGFVVVPEREKRQDVVPLGVHDNDDKEFPVDAAAALVLGIDEQAHFSYILRFQKSGQRIITHLQAIDGDGEVQADFDDETNVVQVTGDNELAGPIAKPILMKLAGVASLHSSQVYRPSTSSELKEIVSKIFAAEATELHYPRHRNMSIYLQAFEMAARKAAAQGIGFSLKFNN